MSRRRSLMLCLMQHTSETKQPQPQHLPGQPRATALSHFKDTYVSET